MTPGEYQIAKGNAAFNQGWEIYMTVVENHGDRPVQAGSYYHFYEVSPALHFDRLVACNSRLNIAAGIAVRSEPGQEREIELMRVADAQRIVGFRSEVMGVLEANNE